MQKLNELKTLLSTPKKILIIPHQKPDADALGSSLGLASYLKKLAHQTSVISPTDYPKFLSWMQGNEDVLNFEDQTQREKIKTLIQAADLVFCLDFSSLSRIEELGKWVLETKKPIILIDHHTGKENFADFELWVVEASSTSELIYDFIDLMQHKHLIDVPITECLYAGMMTDTGSFKYRVTTPKVHRIVADFIEMGLDHTKIHRLIFDNSSEKRMKMLGFALSQRMVVLPEYYTAYFTLSEQDLQNFDSQTGDTEGFVNYALSIEGVKFAAIFTDRENSIRVSFRSVGDFPANEFARKHFSGGGHLNAAGAKLYNLSLENAVKRFISVLPDYKNKLEKTSDF